MMRFFAALLVLACLSACAAIQADDTIRQAQSRLHTLGFYSGQVDGSMGSQTSAAIRRYQIAENLKVTGELNQQTLDRLGIKSATQQQVPAYVALADIFRGGPYISSGPEMQIAVVRQAQKNLKLLGYYTGAEDGAPSPALVAAIKLWQKSAGFRVNGRFDENTLKGLDLMPN